MKGKLLMKKSDKLNNTAQDGGRKKGTFIVKVEYSQHETYQGQVIWAEGNKSKRFRSMLELIRLMDDVMKSDEARGEDRKDSVS